MFSYKVQSFKDKKGRIRPLIFIVSDNSEAMKEYGKELKKFDANYISNNDSWGWYGSAKDNNKTKELIDTKVKPAIEYLESIAGGNDVETRVIGIIDELIKQLENRNTDSEVEAEENVMFSTEQVKNRLLLFKEKLVTTMNDEEFKKVFAPFIKFKRAQGYQFSLKNAIMARIQDPKSTMVKSKDDWQKMNRTIKPGSPGIWLWVPSGGTRVYSGEEGIKAGKKVFMQANGIESDDSMTPGEHERMRHHIRQKENNSGFFLSSSFYDVRFTIQMEGKEDLVGDGDTSNLPWYDDSGKETEAVGEKIYALLQVVADSTVNVSTTKNLNGALGVSKGGQIDVLEDAKKNDNYLLTLTHEFAHEALHHRYLQAKNNDFSKFYQGRERGRGFVEQQAELTGWLVCNFYGYDPKTSINYSVMWGMTPENAVFCFDSVAKLANDIIDKMNIKIMSMRGINTVKESIDRGMLREAKYTGAEVANLVGAGKLYQQGMKNIEQDENIKTESLKAFNEMIEKFNNINKRNAQDRLD